MIVSIFLTGCGTKTNSESVKDDNPSKLQQNLIEMGWDFETPNEGEMPETYGVKGIFGMQDNYFDIKMGADYDLVIKIMNCQNDECIRYVFIPNNTTTTIHDIPQGKYYLKLSYGNDWMTNTTEKSIKGKFTENVVYERGQTIFDFGKKNSQSNISYQLEIQVENHVLTKTFETEEITEEEFFE